MSSESQEEELEVLRSIYEGDENFKEINLQTFQYKVSYHILSNLLSISKSFLDLLEL